MPRKPKIFQDPKNPEKIIVESPPCTSYFLRTKDAGGNYCKPWAIEEQTIIQVRSMDSRDYRGHREKTLLLAIEYARQLASRLI